MNEEYLWDKTGGDAEIEGFEKVLQTFRYKADEPPTLPAKTFSLAEKPRRNWFQLGFVVAFASVAVLTVPTIWFLATNRDLSIRTEMVRTHDPVLTVAGQNDVPEKIAIRPASGPESKRTSSSRTIKPAIKPLKTVAVNSKSKDQPVKLTKEEKYAYGQLMLALSITESKLKIVRDTIAGDDESKSALQRDKDLFQK